MVERFDWSYPLFSFFTPSEEPLRMTGGPMLMDSTTVVTANVPPIERGGAETDSTARRLSCGTGGQRASTTS